MLSNDDISAVISLHPSASYGARSGLIDFARAIEQAARNELLAGVGMEPVAWRLPFRLYSDRKDAEFDWRNAPAFENTGYAPEPLYTADQLAAAVAKAKAEQREADASICMEKHENGNWKYDTRHECADAIREGGNSHK